MNRCSRLLSAFGHAFAGLFHAFRTQRNIPIHLTIAAGVMALGLWLDLSRMEWAILALTIGIVLSAELLNSSLETVVDMVSPEYHPMAKRAKDIAAGAVLLTAIVAVVVGLLILGPPLWARLVAALVPPPGSPPMLR
ncbi:MAG: diacylglycerol kinase family protein [Anaerolineae bacterium]|nr:diacylglycerol kinase family protein [Anaerolineae bacterium]MDW8067801.1 diacylglycerol kinase family protein [Anaerolineae bacterium]